MLKSTAFVTLFSKILDIFKKRSNTSDEIKDRRTQKADDIFMILLYVCVFVIVIDNLFSVGIGSYVYDLTDKLITYFLQ